MILLRVGLLAVLTWRLLLPPGVCLCQLMLPAAGALARLLGNEPPAPEAEDSDHHRHGCPASRLGPSLRPQPPDSPQPPAPAFDMPACTDPSAAASAEHAVPAPSSLPPVGDALFLTFCAFLI